MIRCPVCRTRRASVFFATPPLPVTCNVFHADPAVARDVPRGRIDLAFCPDCGMVHNAAFEPQLVEYDADYETSLHHSPRFRGFAERTAQRLVATHRLNAKAIVELGCGRGDFLRLFAGDGNRLIGFDRSYDGRLDAELEIHRAHYAPATHGRLDADLVICRHVLEHLVDPGALLELMHSAVAPAGALYLEVPDARFTLCDGGVFDLIYEHCGYFTAAPFERLCCERGFVPLRVESEFGGQFLAVDARPGDADPRLDPLELEPAVARFSADFDRRLGALADRIDTDLDRGARVAIWGAGSKGVTFVNLLPRGAELAAVVDINPQKHGRHIAGTGQRIIAPTELGRLGIDLVIVMNPIYRQEIERTLHELGLAPALLVAS